jgi:hypothetical protein
MLRHDLVDFWCLHFLHICVRLSYLQNATYEYFCWDWRKICALFDYKLIGNVWEEVGDWLAVVSSTHGLGKHHGHINTLKQINSTMNIQTTIGSSKVNRTHNIRWTNKYCHIQHLRVPCWIPAKLILSVKLWSIFDHGLTVFGGKQIKDQVPHSHSSLTFLTKISEIFFYVKHTIL